MQKIKRFFNKRSGENVNTSEDLVRLELESIGSSVTLHELPDERFEKLLQIIRTKSLRVLVLRYCFNDADKLCSVLQVLRENPNIKKISLDLRNNQHNIECAREICKLISRKIILAIYLPEGLDEACAAEILYAIKDAKEEVRDIDISESVLSDDAISYLEDILKNRIVRYHLVMKKCDGVSETTLTTKHYEKLKNAEMEGRRLHFFDQKVNITWFNYVQHAEGNLDRSEWQKLKVVENIPTFCKGKAGKVETVVRHLVRKKKGPWQLLSSRIRRIIEPSKPAKVPKQEVDELSDMFGRQEFSLSNSELSPAGNTLPKTKAPYGINKADISYTNEIQPHHVASTSKPNVLHNCSSNSQLSLSVPGPAHPTIPVQDNALQQPNKIIQPILLMHGEEIESGKVNDQALDECPHTFRTQSESASSGAGRNHEAASRRQSCPPLTGSTNDSFCSVASARGKGNASANNFTINIGSPTGKQGSPKKSSRRQRKRR